MSSVIVIGSGISGLISCYYLAKEKNLNIILIEKKNEFGGNGKYALSGINLIQTKEQEILLINDTINNFKRDIYYAGNFHFLFFF